MPKTITITITMQAGDGEVLELPPAIASLLGAGVSADVRARAREEGPARKPPGDAAIVAPGGGAIIVPRNPHPKHRSQILRDGRFVEVPARLAAVLAKIAEGAEVVSYRPETAEAMQELLPDLLPGLTRDWSRKVIGKHASYTVAPWVREAVKFNHERGNAA